MSISGLAKSVAGIQATVCWEVVKKLMDKIIVMYRFRWLSCPDGSVACIQLKKRRCVYISLLQPDNAAVVIQKYLILCRSGLANEHGCGKMRVDRNFHNPFMAIGNSSMQPKLQN
jgi:hypothetical protein